MEPLATKATNPILETIPIYKGERLELQKKLYNYIITKWNESDKDFIPLNRSEISQAIECGIGRVSNVVSSLIDKGIVKIDRLKKRNINIYKVLGVRTGTDYDLSPCQQEILIFLHHRNDAYNVGELSNKVAMEYFSLVNELKGLREKALISMWHSKESDGYAYNVKNNEKGKYEAILIEFFCSKQDSLKIRKEREARFNKMRSNQALLARIKKAKEKEKDLQNYGACVEIGERRRLGDISANAIKNYNILCSACAGEVLLEAFKNRFIEAITEAKNEIDNGKLYHTQKFRFPFYGCVDRLVAISLVKSYTYDFNTSEIKEVLVIDKINCNLISKANKFKQGLANEN